MVNQQAADLVIGLITAIKARGSVRKTMLLKFLYLADIANYRANGETFTGFDWIFHRFGPWAREYDELLESLQETGQVSIESTDWEDDKAYESIRSEEKRDLHGVFPSLEAQHELSLALDALADKPLGEILDHVYFETEPMEGAERLSRLDFSKVDRGRRIRLYKPKRPKLDSKKVAAARALIRKMREQQEVKRKPALVLVDDACVELMNRLNSEM